MCCWPSRLGLRTWMEQYVKYVFVIQRYIMNSQLVCISCCFPHMTLSLLPFCVCWIKEKGHSKPKQLIMVTGLKNRRRLVVGIKNNHMGYISLITWTETVTLPGPACTTTLHITFTKYIITWQQWVFFSIIGNDYFLFESSRLLFNRGLRSSQKQIKWINTRKVPTNATNCEISFLFIYLSQPVIFHSAVILEYQCVVLLYLLCSISPARCPHWFSFCI